MNRRRFIGQTAIASLWATASTQAWGKNPAPQPSPRHIDFDGRRFELAWHAAPQPAYLKLEYLPSGQSLPQYEDMLLLEHLSSGMDIAQVVGHQLEFLRERKKTDPVTQHRILQKESQDEFLLDFVLSAKDPKLGDIIEWNAYRYLKHPGPDGQPGVLLFAYSRRAYGHASGTDFLLGLAQRKQKDIQTLLNSPVPELRAADSGTRP